MERSSSLDGSDLSLLIGLVEATEHVAEAAIGNPHPHQAAAAKARHGKLLALKEKLLIMKESK